MRRRGADRLAERVSLTAIGPSASPASRLYRHAEQPASQQRAESELPHSERQLGPATAEATRRGRHQCRHPVNRSQRSSQRPARRLAQPGLAVAADIGAVWRMPIWRHPRQPARRRYIRADPAPPAPGQSLRKVRHVLASRRPTADTTARAYHGQAARPSRCHPACRRRPPLAPGSRGVSGGRPGPVNWPARLDVPASAVVPGRQHASAGRWCAGHRRERPTWTSTCPSPRCP